MIAKSCDVLVLGSGFAGSLVAILLRQSGRDVVLVDRGSHPRFAIGESSTPLADLMLRRLAEDYAVPQLASFSRYGTWKRDLPEITCGLKRGFSYFTHRPDQSFTASEEHETELLVAASAADEAGDTHWYRPEMDAYLARLAEQTGVQCLERIELHPDAATLSRWSGRRGEEEVAIRTEFVIDATGGSDVVAAAVGAVPRGGACLTNSRCVYGHWRDLVPWSDWLGQQGVPQSDHPFRCDRAAVHHLLDEGWMWQLAFDNGVTSAGIVVDGSWPSEPRGTTAATAGERWQRILHRYPSIESQFHSARVVDPPRGLVTSSRLQRRWSRAAGTGWAMLPAAAGFIDPLHSTGIAHSVFEVARLTRLLTSANPREREQELRLYEQDLFEQLDTIDHFVAACYATRHDMSLFAAATALYFTAAIHCEQRLVAGESPAFLSTDTPALIRPLKDAALQLRAQAADSHDHAGRTRKLLDFVRRTIEPWNIAGLLNPAAANMYHHTAAPK